jgi:hypothetical protein
MCEFWKGLNGQLFTNPDDFSWTVTTQDATINTAGMNYLTNADGMKTTN